jgi:2-(1,2-epoxy-1,2-dihydrophenyl)acetyl-CoA isomerase
VEFETILYEVETGVATITLNRPDKLNAFTPKMHEELREGFKQIKRDQAVRAVLITGAGRGFCAGADLNERDLSPEAGPPDLGATLERNYNRLVRLIRASEKPVVAAVNGIAAGAGCNTALACDIVIAARSAAFLQAFVHIGVIPDAGGTYSLPRLVGQARATAMAMLGDKIPAEDAAQWGMIWKVVDDEALAGVARAIAERLAAGPTKAFGLMKRAFDAGARNDLGTQLDLERDLQTIAGRSEDHREGVAAFREKRKAAFKGR